MSYAMMEKQLAALLDTTDVTTNAAQMSAFLFQELKDVNWVGFYIQREPRILRLGPFQGKPACNPIPFDQGVCGKAARTLTTQRVADVHDFPGHIACDAASRSELVIPITLESGLWGVLDIDSPEPDRFSEEDAAGIEALCRVFIQQTAFIS
ncbi:GAF domain-containing protein [Larsenimonas rhizosphaerae]|uniref:GAF domain-containing protein n=1 Tax=Larsenimonas rhizosphaerae TaxID=2944682 RepID=A0AA42CWW7_9GAMM|nr:GAF domain-containing protein [Larsenimonas rhizosphaerae]MCX2523148.1 GAF domain-containing protein [Larsenimonas rhizosphaerae]